MKKNYNIPATQVVAFKSEAMIMAGSPGPAPLIDPNPNGNGGVDNGGPTD